MFKTRNGHHADRVWLGVFLGFLTKPSIISLASSPKLNLSSRAQCYA